MNARPWAVRAGRRIVFCCVLTVIGAIPSYCSVVGTYDVSYDLTAMFVGVEIYALLWSVIACLPVTDRLLAMPLARRAVGIGFIVRLMFTLALPVSVMFDAWMENLIEDRVAVILPSGFVPHGPGCDVLFTPTLVIALLVGAVHSLMLIVFVTGVWALQLVGYKPPQRGGGFPVVMGEGRSARGTGDGGGGRG